MPQSREEAFIELVSYANQYFHGLNAETSVGKVFGEKLQEIKKAYHQVDKFKYTGIVPEEAKSEKNGLVLAGAGIVFWAVFFLIMPENVNIRYTYAFVLAIAAQIITKEYFLGMVPCAAYIVGVLTGTVIYMIPVHMAVLALYSLEKKFGKQRKFKQRKDTLSSGRNNLLRLQAEINKMLPDVRKELQNYADQWYERNTSVLIPEDKKDFMGKDFPAAFWWQVSPEDLYEIDHIFGCEKYGNWETRLVHRSSGQEFDASEEYSPIFAQKETVKGKISNYFPIRNGYKVYDLISRVTFVSAQAQTVQYEVPAHSQMSKLAVNMGVMSLAHSIDKTYNQGKISYGDYRTLANEMFGLGMLAAEYGKETKTEEITEYIPIHNHSNFWTGQVVLKEIEPGSNVYSLWYYACQLPHMFENFEALRDINIGYIDCDFWTCNPYFLARFFSEFPDAV